MGGEEVVLEAAKDVDEDQANHGIEGDPPVASSKSEV